MIPSSTLGKLALFFVVSAVGLSGLAIISVMGVFGLGIYVVRKAL